MDKKKSLKVLELFAGVGGFRLGLEGFKGKSASSNYKENLNSSFEIIWSNQFEPSTKTQYASQVYEQCWGENNHICKNINDVDISSIPDADVLVAGFPCQDYSVATSLKNSKGIEGKKGVLWWNIYNILLEKENKPKYLILENVDRLLSSPSKQRGRDFAIILKSLNDLGYAIEWKVVNAADYGMPQKRKRVFIVAFHNSTKIYENILNNFSKTWILEKGVLSNAFPSENIKPLECFQFKGDIKDISKNFEGNFENSGLCVNDSIFTIKTKSIYKGKYTYLKDVLVNEDEVPSEFYISEKDLEKWIYLKGSKKELRNSKGFEYWYCEGSMTFPDDLNKPSRTIITSEGGKSPSRFTHLIKVNDRFRRLLPIELERLCMFPDNHTLKEKISNSKRAFFMGNALVVGIVEKIGIALTNKILEYERQK